MMTYGDALYQCGNKSLAWRQFEAAKLYFEQYRQEVKGYRSEGMYLSALLEWAQYSLALHQQSLEKCLDLYQDLEKNFTLALGVDHLMTIQASLEVAKLLILCGNYQRAVGWSKQAERPLLKKLDTAPKLGERNQEQNLVKFSRLLSKSQTLTAIGSYFCNEEAEARILLGIAQKHAYEGKDEKGHCILSTFQELFELMDTRGKKTESLKLTELYNKTCDDFFKN